LGEKQGEKKKQEVRQVEKIPQVEEKKKR